MQTIIKHHQQLKILENENQDEIVEKIDFGEIIYTICICYRYNLNVIFLGIAYELNEKATNKNQNSQIKYTNYIYIKMLNYFLGNLSFGVQIKNENHREIVGIELIIQSQHSH